MAGKGSQWALGVAVASAVLALLTPPARGAGAAEDALLALVPAPDEVPGFSGASGWPRAPEPNPYVGVETDASTFDAHLTGKVNEVSRGIFSADGTAILNTAVKVGDSVETAHGWIAWYYQGWQARPATAPFAGRPCIGDECWSKTFGPNVHLATRIDRAYLSVNVVPVPDAIRKAGAGGLGTLPSVTVEAVLHSMVVRCSRQPGLTGVRSQAVAVAVAGTTLPDGSALKIGDWIYVRPRAMAAAAGWKHDWDAKKAVLTLRRPGGLGPAVVLPSVPGQVPDPVALPLWSDQGEPMMALADLATAMNARLSQDALGVIQVNVP